MRPSKYLISLKKYLQVRLYKIKNSLDEVVYVHWPHNDLAFSSATIECLNIWHNFSRAYYLSCVLSPLKADGTHIMVSNSAIRTYQDAVELSIRRFKPWIYKKGKWSRRDEPAWHSPSILIDCCTDIGCSNVKEIINAFSVQTAVFEHLPKFRNFYAHRNKQTAEIAIKVASVYSIPTHNHPTQILSGAAYGRPQALLLDWIDDISLVAGLLCY